MQAYQSRQAQTRAQEMGLDLRVGSSSYADKQAYESIREKFEGLKKETAEMTIKNYSPLMKRILRVTDAVGLTNPKDRINNEIMELEGRVRSFSDLENFYDKELETCFEKAATLTKDKHEKGDQALSYDQFITGCQQDKSQQLGKYEQLENRLASGTVQYQERARIRQEMDMIKNNVRQLESDVDKAAQQQSELATEYTQIEARENINERYMLQIQVMKGQLNDHKNDLAATVGKLKVYAEQQGSGATLVDAITMMIDAGEATVTARDLAKSLGVSYNRGIDALDGLPNSPAGQKEDDMADLQKLKKKRDDRREATMNRIRESIHGGDMNYVSTLTPTNLTPNTSVPEMTEEQAPVVTESEGQDDLTFTAPVSEGSDKGNGKDYHPPSDFIQ